MAISVDLRNNFLSISAVRKEVLSMSSCYDAFWDPGRSDHYFKRTFQVLREMGKDPEVSMEIFPSKDGILCGMDQIVDNLVPLLDGVPEPCIVRYLSEGS